jgi:hypothetical protein
MNEENLEQLLKGLKAEIGSGQSLTEDQREALAKIHAEVERALEEPDGESAPVESLRNFVEELEDAHPTLTLTLGRIMDALNKMGI